MVPPLVERAQAEGLVWRADLGALAHVLAGERGRSRVGTTIPEAAPWLASALAPGVPLFVERGKPLGDPDVHVCETIADEAPFDLLVTDRAEVAGLLVPGGMALVVGSVPQGSGLFTVPLGEGATLALLIR